MKSGTTLGEKKPYLYEGVVIGGNPQHVNVPEKLGGSLSATEMPFARTSRSQGDATRPRHAHRQSLPLCCMCNSHVAHDCRLGDNVILTNNVMLAGHVTIGSRALPLPAERACTNSAALGTWRWSAVSPTSRVPPFVTIDGQSSYVVGLNQVGLKPTDLRQVHRAVERSLSRDLPQRPRLEGSAGRAPAAIPGRRSCRVLPSLTKRGIIPERRMPPGSTIRIHTVEEKAVEEKPEEDTRRAKAG